VGLHRSVFVACNIKVICKNSRCVCHLENYRSLLQKRPIILVNFKGSHTEILGKPFVPATVPREGEKVVPGQYCWQRG